MQCLGPLHSSGLTPHSCLRHWHWHWHRHRHRHWHRLCSALLGLRLHTAQPCTATALIIPVCPRRGISGSLSSKPQKTWLEGMEEGTASGGEGLGLPGWPEAFSQGTRWKKRWAFLFQPQIFSCWKHSSPTHMWVVESRFHPLVSLPRKPFHCFLFFFFFPKIFFPLKLLFYLNLLSEIKLFGYTWVPFLKNRNLFYNSQLLGSSPTPSNLSSLKHKPTSVRCTWKQTKTRNTHLKIFPWYLL